MKNQPNAFLRLESTEPTSAISIHKYFVIGASNECDLNIQEPNIESHHAVIEKANSQYVLRDLKSKSGTFVNSTQILLAVLNHGDIIRIGSNNYSFFHTDSPLPCSTAKQIKSNNPSWNSQLRSLPNLARSDFPILILGESGVGKEVLTSAIHGLSKRSQAPLVSINCSAISENLIESELFGHIKGSFTGASSSRKGAFEAARGGTLFLDEVGDLPTSMQPKLLRALENQEIRPIGADQTIKTDVRIVAATHKNIFEKMEHGTFRRDLFYRLNVLQINIPELRNRMEDFESLLYSFARKFRVRFSHQAILALKTYKWPGNIRELKNFIAKVSVLHPYQHIDAKHIESLLPKDVLSYNFDPQRRKEKNLIKNTEREIIFQRLKANHGNQRKTASELGIAKSTLHDRIKTYQIDVKKLTQPTPSASGF